jgi:exosortase H (IPTLxxWG-CTERM-specific)
MIKFLILFCILAVLGLAVIDLEALLPAIHFFCLILAKMCGFLIHLFDNSLIITERVLRHGEHGFALEVAKDCSGLSASWLLLATMVAFKSHWKHKLTGFVLGFLILQAFNVVRIISLFYVGDILPEHFDMIHKQIWPLFLNISMIFIFGGWLFYTISNNEYNET